MGPRAGIAAVALGGGDPLVGADVGCGPERTQVTFATLVEFPGE